MPPASGIFMMSALSEHSAPEKCVPFQIEKLLILLHERKSRRSSDKGSVYMDPVFQVFTVSNL